MHTIQELILSGKFVKEELDALEFALELVTEAWVEELKITQEHIDTLKKTGMMN